jgi:hypothetical protein
MTPINSTITILQFLSYKIIINNTYSRKRVLTKKLQLFSIMTAARPFDADKAWNDHLKRLGDIDKMYPSYSPISRYSRPLSLSAKPLYDIHGESRVHG